MATAAQSAAADSRVGGATDLLGGATHLLDGVQQRREQVRVVVGALPLQDPHQSLQSHPSVHAALGEPPQTAVHLPDTHTHTHSYWELASRAAGSPSTHRLYSMKTRFQSSTRSGWLALTSAAAWRPPTWS